MTQVFSMIWRWCWSTAWICSGRYTIADKASKLRLSFSWIGMCPPSTWILNDAESGKRDYSRPLLSELDVKVSLHPAQASQRPCEGPVSSLKTCWLYDTEPKSMPLRGREHQWNKATDICNTFCTDSSVVLVPRHRREVSPLARRVMWQPVSAPLQDGIRFFPPPYPHALGWPYDLPPFARRGSTGLPRSTRLTRTGEVLSVRR
jgi:hypothetical protein